LRRFQRPAVDHRASTRRITWVGGTGSHGVFTLAPGPTGSTTLFGDWAGTPLQSAIGGICYSGVDQTTPFSGHVDATPTLATGVTTTVASVTVTGCTAGQTIVAAIGALSDTVTLSAFSAVAGTTLRVSDVTGTFVGVALLEKVATGASETLSVNVNASSSGGLYWTARGARVNDAAGGAEGPVGRADEVDTALAMSALQITAAGMSAETDTAQALAAVQITAAGLASETDSAEALAAIQIGAVGISDEADTAVALAALQISATGVAVETDTAFDLAAAAGNAVGMATEEDTAQALAAVQFAAVGVAEEAETAFALIPLQAAEVGAATEQDFALWLDAVQIAALGMAAETDTALALADGSEPAVVVLSAPPASRRLQPEGRTPRVQASSRTPRTQTRAR
jgi:hypothetical protein